MGQWQPHTEYAYVYVDAVIMYALCILYYDLLVM